MTAAKVGGAVYAAGALGTLGWFVYQATQVIHRPLDLTDPANALLWPIMLFNGGIRPIRPSVPLLSPTSRGISPQKLAGASSHVIPQRTAVKATPYSAGYTARPVV